jgi:tetratricopeptide (TPR) repeat protein
MPQAKAAARKALEIDDTLAEAHTTLARVLTVYDWDWSGAEKEFHRAIELNPRYPLAHTWYGGYLQVMGRSDESLAQMKQARELDPLSPLSNFLLARGFYYAREYDQAIEQFQEALKLDPSFQPALGFLPGAYEQKGMHEEALTGFQKAITLTKGEVRILSMSGLGHFYAVSGRKGEARTVLNQLKQLAQEEYVSADSIARIYAGLGEKDQAFAWLEKACDEHSYSIAWLKVEPAWDSLRSDPRFAELLRRMGLER